MAQQKGETKGEQVEPIVFKAYASFFNPDVEVTCLKAPPRESQDEIACKWHFKL